jgi:hypothetical protein
MTSMTAIRRAMLPNAAAINPHVRRQVGRPPEGDAPGATISETDFLRPRLRGSGRT